MKRSTFLSTVAITALVSQGAFSAERIHLKEGVFERIKESHRLHQAANAMKNAQREISVTFGHPHEASQNTNSVTLPLCDEERMPLADWKYVSPGESDRVLKYVGGVGFGPHYIRWDSAWLRIAGSRHIYREGMFCGDKKYAVVDIDRSFSASRKFKNTPMQLVDGAFLHLSAKAFSESPSVVEAELSVASTGSIPVRVAVELWSQGVPTPKLLATTWEYVSSDPLNPKTIRVEAETNAATLMVVRLDPALREVAAKGESDAQLLVFGASIHQR